MKKQYDQINNFLDGMKYGQDIAFETLFHKRSPFEIRINNYNPNLLKAWRANMDLDFFWIPMPVLFTYSLDSHW